MPLTAITELTEGTVEGNGAFDKLMAAGRAHLDQEYKKGSLRGPEYSQVYIGMIQSAMQGGMNWIIQGAKLDLERELLATQVEMAKVQKQIADIELLKANAELEMLELQKPKIIAEVKLIEAQVIQMEAENTLIPKKAQLMDAEVLYKEKQGEMITSEIANSVKQGELIDVQKIKMNQEIQNLAAEELGIAARTILTTNQSDNEVVQGTVLVAQECKLRAEFDLTMNQINKTTSETTLLTQKVLTEKAQTQSVGVDDNSVIGRQKILYVAQTNGFTRDAEQKVAKILIDTWNARRMTDEGTVADGVNKLNDATIGRAVEKLLIGVGA